MTNNGPNFLIVGAARAGTTVLADALRAHPEVFVTRPKEPHFWALHDTSPSFRGPGDDVTINATSVVSWDDYAGLYADAQANAVALGDASVSSLYYYERAIPRIREANPAMRIIVVLREPVSRAYSAYSYLRARSREPLDSFADALADEDRRVAEHWHHLWHYRRMGLYSPQIAAYIDAFGAQNVHVDFYDNIQANLPTFLERVESFLQVSHVESPRQSARVNVSGEPRSAFASSIARGVAGSRVLKPIVRSITSRKVRERVRTGLLKPSAGLPNSERAQIAREYKEDLQELSAILGDVAWRPTWLPDPTP